jgi:hypothetical protein
MAGIGIRVSGFGFRVLGSVRANAALGFDARRAQMSEALLSRIFWGAVIMPLWGHPDIMKMRISELKFHI